MYRILIVDDEAKIREVLAEYAEFEGFASDQAADGMEAVNKCKNEDYDLILMDIMMPKLDGYSAVKEIRKFKDIPVIMLSARGEEYDKLFGFEIGADDYVVKPFSRETLRQNRPNRTIPFSNSRGLKSICSAETFSWTELKPNSRRKNTNFFFIW